MERRRWSWRGLVGAAVALVVCSAVGVAQAQSEPVAARIEAIVRESRNAALRWPRFPDYQHIVLGIYGPRSFAPLWLEGGTPTKQAGEAIDALGAAGAQGLDPRDYDAAWLAERRSALASGAPANPDDLARFDTGAHGRLRAPRLRPSHREGESEEPRVRPRHRSQEVRSRGARHRRGARRSHRRDGRERAPGLLTEPSAGRAARALPAAVERSERGTRRREAFPPAGRRVRRGACPRALARGAWRRPRPGGRKQPRSTRATSSTG